MSAPITRRLFKNSSAMAAARVVTLFIGFAALPVIISSIGMTLYGIWVIVFGMVKMLTVLDLGVGSTFVTQLAMARTRQDARQMRQVITLSVLFYGGFAVVLSPVIFLLMGHLPVWFHVSRTDWAVMKPLIWWIYGFVFVAEAFSSLGAFAVASQRLVMVSVTGIIGQLVNYGLLILLLLEHVGLKSFVIALYASWLVSSLIYFVSAYRALKTFPFVGLWPFPKALAKALLAFGGWLQITRIAGRITNEADRILIGIYVNTATAGVFQIAYQVAQMARQFPSMFMGAFLPVVSTWEASHERARIRAAYEDASRYLAAATFFIGIFAVSSERFVFHLWLKHHYSGEYTALILLTLAVLVNNLTRVGTTILQGIAKPRQETFYAVMSAAIKVAISLALAARFKLVGILLGTAIGTVIGSVYFLWSILRYLRLSWREGLWSWIGPIVLSASVSGGLTFAISQQARLPAGRGGTLIVLSLLGLLYTGLFFLSLRLFRFYRRSDYERVRRILPARWIAAAQKVRLLPVFRNLS